MQQMADGCFSIWGPRAITQVVTSKLIDVYGFALSSDLKMRVSVWLADNTKMNSADFFDPKTHKGFLNKDILNRCRKIPANEKRWV